MDRDALFHNNQRLVGMVLRRSGIYTDSDMYEDYRQIGYIGLLKAARNFKPELGFTFFTYAVSMIHGEIRREKRDNSGHLHIPRPVKEAYSRYYELEKQGYEDKEICEQLGVTMAELQEIKTAYIPVASLDAPHPGFQKKNSDDKVVLLGDSLSADYNLEEECISKVYWDHMFSGLTEIERVCVELRSAEMTQEQIAKRMGTSQVWVSRTLIKAKKKLSEMLGGAA